MAVLSIPGSGRTLTHETEITAYLKERGIRYECWRADEMLTADATQEQILSAYRRPLAALMAEGGYQTADTINVHGTTPNLGAIRQKFLAEHTHSEDEVRFFVDGQGTFWFHLDRHDDAVFSVRCEAGDLLSVPAGIKHWFDLGANPDVKVIRIFTSVEGWVPAYTNSGIDQRYNPAYAM